jgi:hypothetical protein
MTLNVGCIPVTCPGGVNFTVTVVGTAVASAAYPCIYDSAGNAITTASSTCPGTITCPQAGCTPGFWKNCTIHWGPTGFSTGQHVGDVFDIGNCCPEVSSATLLQALAFGGGSGTCGAVRNLLRAGVAALLNASSPEVDYPRTTADVINDINAALATCNRGSMLSLAGDLDRDNNLGCRDSSGNSLPCKVVR